MKKVLKVMGIVVLGLVALYLISGIIGAGMIMKAVNDGIIVLG